MGHALTQLVLELLKRYFPAKMATIEPFSEPFDEELAIKVYKQWLVPTYVLLLIWVAFFAYFGGKEAAKLTKYLIQLVHKDAVVINFEMPWYLILGFVSAVYYQDFLNWLVITLKGEQTLRLLNYGTQLKTDYNLVAVTPLIKKAVLLFALIIVVLGGVTHLRLYEDRFVIGNPILYKDEVYPFNQIASITYAEKIHYSNGDNRNSPSIEIKMKDNSIWQSNDFDIERDSFVFKSVEQGANVKIDSMPLLYKSKSR